MTLVIQKTAGSNLVLANGQKIPAVIGEPWGGGYFAGYISHTADGNPTHALIVAPRATGASGTGYALTTNYQLKNANTATAGTTSTFDGVANTAAMVTAGISNHPAAEFCVNLNIGGYTDWYLPARFELDIAYFNLKPSSTAIITGVGANTYAVPQRNSNYSGGYPTQTTLTAWQATAGVESFIANNHWSSTESFSTNSEFISFNDGNRSSNSKTITVYRTRAFRRIAL